MAILLRIKKIFGDQFENCITRLHYFVSSETSCQPLKVNKVFMVTFATIIIYFIEKRKLSEIKKMLV